MSYYLYAVTNGRNFANFDKNIESPSFLFTKRVTESYHYFFVILGLGPVTITTNVKNKVALTSTAKQAGMSLLQKLVNHYTHTTLALLCLKVGGNVMTSMVKCYDSRYRREYVYWGRFFSVLRLPSSLAILIGSPPAPGDAEHFDSPNIDPSAARQDAGRRVMLYEAAKVFTQVLFNDVIAPKFKLDKVKYAITPSTINAKLVNASFNVLGAEAGAFIGRFIGNKFDQHFERTTEETSLAGGFEFGFEFVIGMASCVIGTKLGMKWFPQPYMRIAAEDDEEDEESKPLLAEK